MYNYLVLITNVVSLIRSDVTCSTGETYVKFVKNNPSSWASEESFKVYSGSTLLYTSPEFANSEVRTIEQCLTTSTNNQYSIELLDSYGDSWTSGSYLTIYGENENVVFKNFLTASSQETYTFSLYYGIAKSDTWKMTYGSISGDWTAYSFSDSTWSDATLGSVTTTVSGTQYFRKQFVCLASMAAYDVRLYYQAGVIAYINGAEIYRDNMPAGDITSTTAATGQYTNIAYRGFIRPGSEWLHNSRFWLLRFTSLLTRHLSTSMLIWPFWPHPLRMATALFMVNLRLCLLREAPLSAAYSTSRNPPITMQEVHRFPIRSHSRLVEQGLTLMQYVCGHTH